MKNSYGVDVVTGRWGFHAVDYPTYAAIKILHRDYHAALRVAASRRRWAAKMPHNRRGPEPAVTPRMTRLLGSDIVSLYGQVRAAYPAADDVPGGVAAKAKAVIDYVAGAAVAAGV